MKYRVWLRSPSGARFFAESFAEYGVCEFVFVEEGQPLLRPEHSLFDKAGADDAYAEGAELLASEPGQYAGWTVHVGLIAAGAPPGAR